MTPHALLSSPARAALFALLAFAPFAAACNNGRVDPSGPARGARDFSGLYWARFTDVPEGMRVQLWLDSDGERVRGAYASMPWSGDLEGRATDNGVDVTFFEHGVTSALGARIRHATLRWDARRTELTGTDAAGAQVELVRAGFTRPEMRAGLWVSHWTGLPPGMAVETRISRLPDGRWRAVYQYQGNGGVRDGSFEGTLNERGVLAIQWTEHTESGNVARGEGRLAPTALGYRGTYGIDGHAEGTGEWAIDPIEP